MALFTIVGVIWQPYFSYSNYHSYRSEHSTLEIIYLKGGGYPWVIKIDFTLNSILPEIIMNLVKKVIKCSRMVELLQKALNARYDRDSFKSLNSLSVDLSVSSLLYEIVLNELDIFIAKLESRLSCSEVSKKKLLYVRYGKEILIFVRGTKLDANHTRLKVKDFLHYKGLSFNIGEVTNTASGFTFLGAFCRIPPRGIRVSKERNNDSEGGIMCMNVDSSKLYKKLVEWNIARFSNYSSRVPQGTANDSIINFPHVYIIKFYNTKIRELISYYTFVSNRCILKGIIWQIHKSCALTLAKKHKLRTMSASFKKFGKSLDCPITGIKLYKPKYLPTNKYKPNMYGRSFNFLLPGNRILNILDFKNNNSRVLFSTRAIQNLSPYFITGFTDAEGCFRLKICKSSKHTLG